MTINLLSRLSAPNDTNGTNGISAKVQQAFNDLMSDPDGDLYLGQGTFRLESPVVVTPPAGKGWFGRVHGIDQNLTRFVSSVPGMTMLRLNYMWGGSLEHFSVTGSGKSNGIGLLLSSADANMGTSRIAMRDIRANQLSRGIQFGDETAQGQGASAEIVTELLSAWDCGIGVLLTQWNTLDVMFRLLGTGNCNTGVQTAGNSGGAGQLTFDGGSFNNNICDMRLYSYNISINNMRSESDNQAGPRIIGGGPQIDINQFSVATKLAEPIAIDLTNGPAIMSITHCVLPGAIRTPGSNPRSALRVIGNSFACTNCTSTTRPATIAPNSFIYETDTNHYYYNTGSLATPVWTQTGGPWIVRGTDVLKQDDNYCTKQISGNWVQAYIAS